MVRSIQNSGLNAYTYGYDRVGNCWSQTLTAGSGNNFSELTLKSFMTAGAQMKIFLRICFLGGMLMPVGRNISAQQGQRAYQVQLHIIVNGRRAPLPKEVVIRNGKRSVTLPVIGDNIVVPGEMAIGSTLTLQAHIGTDSIRVPNIPRYALETSWTIMLADRTFGGYQYAFSRDADIRSTCLLAFEPEDAEGLIVTAPDCRKPLHKQPTQ
jgi:hypothetical protein